MRVRGAAGGEKEEEDQGAGDVGRGTEGGARRRRKRRSSWGRVKLMLLKLYARNHSCGMQRPGILAGRHKYLAVTCFRFTPSESVDPHFCHLLALCMLRVSLQQRM